VVRLHGVLLGFGKFTLTGGGMWYILIVAAACIVYGLFTECY